MAATQRNISLDVLRCLACLGIVASHTVMEAPARYGFLYTGISVYCSIGIGTFFFISGYLLLPVKSDAETFLKHRFARLLWPLLVWSAVYYLADILSGDKTARWTDTLQVLLYGGSPIMWFMYTILGLYLVSPLVSPWMRGVGRREATLYLLLALVAYSFCVFYGTGVLPSEPDLFYYFAGYAPYFFFGWYVKRFGWPLRMRWYALAAVLSLGLIAVFSGWHLVDDFYRMFWTQSLFSFILVAFVSRLVMGWEGAFRRMGGHVRDVVVTLSNLTFGVYLVHFIVARRLMWNVGWIRDMSSYPLQCLVVVSLTLAATLLVCWLVALTPLGKYVVGCRLSPKD